MKNLLACVGVLCGIASVRAGDATTASGLAKPIEIGSRVEMFVDNFLIDSTRTRGAALQMTVPVRRDVVLTTDKPWEGKGSAYYTVISDGGRIRLYYRGFVPENGDVSDQQVTCCAVSEDGVHFTRPNFGLFEFQNSKENNIVFRGVESHNFAPFLDANPKAKPEERYKAVGGLAGKLYALSSPDGIHWKRMRDEPVMTKGQFDSHNVAFYDEAAKLYRCYSRYWTDKDYKGYRAVQGCTSQDFLTWTEPIANRHHAPDGTEPPPEHFYTNATIACPGAEHHLLSFPMRFLPARKKPSPIKDGGVSDAVFLSSRDGTNWDRSFQDAWLRPGPDDRNWTHRNTMPARGIVPTGDGEFSLYVSEHYAWPDNRLRRVTVRRHGFCSMHAGHAGGEFTTKLLTFTGATLRLNYATSAAGSVRVEVQDEQRNPLPGFGLADMELLYGDELQAAVHWKSGKDFSGVAGKPVRLRFVLKDADMYAFQFKGP